MKVLVPVKRVVDYNVKVRPKMDGSDVDIANAKMSMNPFDEIAVEEAIRLKEKGIVSEIVVTAIGPAKAQETMRTAMAMGADRGIHVESEENVDPLDVAKILKAIVEQESPKMVIMGKQAIDDDNNQTGQMLAGLLAWPQGTFASEVIIAGETVKVTREVDGGLLTLDLNLPAIITTDLRLNEPRFAKLPDIMKARSKPLDTVSPDSLGVTLNPQIKLLKVEDPPKRQGGSKVESVEELVEKLRAEGVLS